MNKTETVSKKPLGGNSGDSETEVLLVSERSEGGQKEEEKEHHKEMDTRKIFPRWIFLVVVGFWVVSHSRAIRAECKTVNPRVCAVDWPVGVVTCNAINGAATIKAGILPLDANNCGQLSKADGQGCAEAIAKVACSKMCGKCNGNVSFEPKICGSVCENLAQSCKQAANAGCFKTVFSKCVADGTDCSNVDINSDYARFDTTTTTTTGGSTGTGGNTGAASVNCHTPFFALVCVLLASLFKK